MPTKARRHGSTAKRSMTERNRNGGNRGYDYTWQKISKMKRAEQPVCEVCRIRAATEVDHIRPFNGIDDPLRTQWSNLQSICRDCHQAKTAAERRR